MPNKATGMSFPPLRFGCPPVFLLTRKQNVMLRDPLQWRNVCNTCYVPIAHPVQKPKRSHTNGTMTSLRLTLSLYDSKLMTSGWLDNHNIALTSARSGLISVRLSSRCVRFITKEMKCRQHKYYTLHFQCGKVFWAQRVTFSPVVLKTQRSSI